ncbi:MAG: hypothetical protein AAFV62_07125 [Pseudomonadota bacterium]
MTAKTFETKTFATKTFTTEFRNPTQAEIDAGIRAAHKARAEAVRDGLNAISQRVGGARTLSLTMPALFAPAPRKTAAQ